MAGNIQENEIPDENLIYEEEDALDYEVPDDQFYDHLLHNGGLDCPQDLPAPERKKLEFLQQFLAKCDPDQLGRLRKIPPKTPPVPAIVNDPNRAMRLKGRVGPQNPPTGTTPASSMATSEDGNALLINNDETFSNSGEDVHERYVDRNPPGSSNNSNYNNHNNSNRGRGRPFNKRAASSDRGYQPQKKQAKSANRGHSLPPQQTQQDAAPSSSFVSVNVMPPPQAAGAGPSPKPNSAYSNNFGSYQQLIPAAAEPRILPMFIKIIGSMNTRRGDDEGTSGKCCYFFNGSSNTPCENNVEHDDRLDIDFCKDARGTAYYHCCRSCYYTLHTCYKHSLKDCALAKFFKANNITYY